MPPRDAYYSLQSARIIRTPEGIMCRTLPYWFSQMTGSDKDRWRVPLEMIGGRRPRIFMVNARVVMRWLGD